MINRQKIVEALTAYIERKGSQNQAAATMQGVSGATLTQMLNRKWDKIADQMWRRVATYIGIEDDCWKQADTSIFFEFAGSSTGSTGEKSCCCTDGRRRFRKNLCL